MEEDIQEEDEEDEEESRRDAEEGIVGQATFSLFLTERGGVKRQSDRRRVGCGQSYPYSFISYSGCCGVRMMFPRIDVASLPETVVGHDAGLGTSSMQGGKRKDLQ